MTDTMTDERALAVLRDFVRVFKDNRALAKSVDHIAARLAERVAGDGRMSDEARAWLVVHGDSNYSSTRVTFDAESAEAERKEGAEVTPLVAQRARELQEAK